MGIGTLLSRVHDDRSSLGSRGLEPGRVRGGVDGQGGRTEITGLWTRGLRLSRGRVRGVKPLQCRGRCLCPGPWDLRAGAGLALLPGAGRGWAGQRGRPRARQRGRAAPGMFNRAVSRLSRKRPPSGNGDGAATPRRARGRSRRGSAGPGCAVLRAALPGAPPGEARGSRRSLGPGGNSGPGPGLLGAPPARREPGGRGGCALWARRGSSAALPAERGRGNWALLGLRLGRRASIGTAAPTGAGATARDIRAGLLELQIHFEEFAFGGSVSSWNGDFQGVITCR